MKTTNKIFRVVKVAFLFVCDIIFAVFGWLFLCFILFVCRADTLYNVLLPYGFYVYILIAFVLIVRNAIHRIKWYILTNPSKRQCTQCHTTVPLSRYKEEHYLKSPISLCVPKISDFFRFTQYRVLLYEIAYRPYWVHLSPAATTASGSSPPLRRPAAAPCRPRCRRCSPRRGPRGPPRAALWRYQG